MKKSLKVLSVIAAVVLGLGLVGCAGDASVDDGYDEVVTDSGKKSNSSSSSNNGSDDSGDVETIGDSWGALFSNGGHNPLDIQNWEGTFECDDDMSDGLKLTTASGWFGGVLCQSGKNGATDEACVFYDMSKVTKMTFKVKASKAMKVSCVYTTGEGKGFNDSTDKPKNVSATTEWKEFTYTAKGASKAYAIFTFVGDDNVKDGDWVMFKDITYFDADGNSVALKYAN